MAQYFVSELNLIFPPIFTDYVSLRPLTLTGLFVKVMIHIILCLKMTKQKAATYEGTYMTTADVYSTFMV